MGGLRLFEFKFLAEDKNRQQVYIIKKGLYMLAYFFTHKKIMKSCENQEELY